QSWLAFVQHQGDDTFASFYEDTKGLVYTICLRTLWSEEEALDAMQNVYSQLLALAQTGEAACQIDIDDLIRRLSFRISGSRSKGLRRALERVDENDEQIRDVTSADVSPREILADKEIHTAVRAAINALEPELRNIIEMRFEQGLTQVQIAERLK